MLTRAFGEDVEQFEAVFPASRSGSLISPFPGQALICLVGLEKPSNPFTHKQFRWFRPLKSALK